MTIPMLDLLIARRVNFKHPAIYPGNRRGRMALGRSRTGDTPEISQEGTLSGEIAFS
jgi:hypothetical protein